MKDIRNLGTVALTIVGVILTAVIGLQVLSALFPTYSGAVKNISTNFSTTDWGDATATNISPIFGLVAALAGLIGIVGLVLLVVNLYHGRKE